MAGKRLPTSVNLMMHIEVSRYTHDFSSVFTQEDLTNVPEPKKMFQGRSEQKLTELRVSTKEVLIKLDKLKVDKSPGVTIFIQNFYLN